MVRQLDDLLNVRRLLHLTQELGNRLLLGLLWLLLLVNLLALVTTLLLFHIFIVI